ncbi:MAG: glutamate racemase [Eubacteriales bacterium]|nr:glutamate racemase [Eubacteriales bacterium]MDY3333083.1 glutamate racemase [Gallibacter sp.]
MDNRPIGFFDSGLGGLTTIPPLKNMLPNESIIYFGDTARTPYGSKAVSTIQNFALQISKFLVENNVKMIVIACNTVSATCLDLLRERFPEVEIVGIISPAASYIVKNCGMHDKIGVIGTKVTISSNTYKNMIQEQNSRIEVFEKACPAFVPLIEEGIIHNDIMDLTIEYYMDDFILENRINTLVLGCTHYPLLKSMIMRKYPNLNIVNPSEEVVFDIKRRLKKRNMLADKKEYEDIFYASDLSENFVNMIDIILEDSDVRKEFKSMEVE